tara:strand:- start:1547 stop:2062 length:516 start_codon:yes stop_codon:yes gene_type:complete
MRLDHLYDAVQIPGSPEWLAAANRRFQDAKTNAWKDVQRDVDIARSQSTPDQSSGDANDWVDFAQLTPSMQIEVLQRFNTDAGFAQEVRERNAALCDALVTEARPAVIDHNRNIVATHFGPENQKQQLLNAYRKAISDESIPVSEVQSDQTMLDLVEHSRPFYPCRVEQLD